MSIQTITYYIILYFLCSISTYFFYQMTCVFVPVRPYKWIKPLVCIALIFIPNVIIFNNDIVNITWAFGGFIIILLLGFEGTLLQKISAAFILYPFVASFNYLVEYLIYLNYNANANSLFYSLHIIIRYLIISLFWYGMYRVFYLRIQSMQQYLTNKMWMLLDIISLTPLLSTGYIIITTTNELQPYSVPIVFVSILSGIGILYLVTYMANSARITIENQNLRLLQNYYEELKHNQQEIRTLRHDMNNHLTTINTYLEQNNVEKARQYFSKLSIVATGTTRIFCKNELVNAVLNAKYNKALELQIDTFFNINLNVPIPMDDLDLCSLFSNTLDNAIENCAKIEKPSHRKLEVKARCEKGFFSYQIENSFVGELRILNGRYQSTKSDTEKHGLGLERIRDIMKKYNGTLDIHHENGQFSVISIIPL